MSKKKLLLVDSSALAFRAHFAFISRPLKRADGFVTSAIYGYANTLLSVLEEQKPDYVAIAGDTGEKNFRHEMFPDYKAHRPPCPPDLKAQLERLDELIGGFGISHVFQVGFEADDVIGTLTEMGVKEGVEVQILSGDKDFMQLIRPGVTMLSPAKNPGEYDIVDEDKVPEKTGVRPDKVIDYLALLGDSSDNVPGAPGIGKVTAKKLLNKYDHLEDIYNNLDEIGRTKSRTSLEENKKQIFLSRDLVTIKTDMEELPKLEDLKFEGVDVEVLLPVLKEFELSRIIRRLGETPAAPVNRSPEVIPVARRTFVDDEKKLEKLFELMKDSERIAVSLLHDEDRKKPELIGIGICPTRDDAFYIPVDEKNLNSCKVDSAKDLAKKIAKVGSDRLGGYDLKELYTYGDMMEIAEAAGWDCYLEATVLRPGGKHEQELLTRQELGYNLKTPKDFSKKSRGKTCASELEDDERMRLACERATSAWHLHRRQKDSLEGLKLRSVVDELEVPLMKVIGPMERRGVCIDKEQLKKASDEAGKELDSLQKEVYEHAGHEFNLNSPQQLGVVLFDEMKLQDEFDFKVKKNKTGYSTDQDTLQKIEEHPVGKALLRYRFLSKMKSTYLDALPGEIRPSTGRIHTLYLQNGTATGRLSSREPNLQNIPMRTEEGARIRKSFLPSSNDRVILSADYSQIELRVLAHFSGDETLIDAFRKGLDIHAATAARVLGKKTEDVDREERSRAKAVNFGLLYGMGARHLAQTTGLSQSDAKDFIDHYFESFPTIRSFLDSLVEKARDLGYASTLAGRRRPLPDLRASGFQKVQAEHMALNTPIQGSAADIIKIAMIALNRKIREDGLDLDILLQVHDELVLECPESSAEQCRKTVIKVMEDTTNLPQDFIVPLKVEATCGPNWLASHS